jgi:hypothetical protein
MNRKLLIVLLLAGVATSLLVGCSGGGSAPSGPSQTTITAQTSSAGLLQAWSGADLSGDELTTPAPCDDSTDEYCVFDFSGVTDGTGTYTLVTDAIPALWSIGATDPYGKTCPAGASWYGTLTAGQGATLECGQLETGNIVATPASCTYTINLATGKNSTTCPSTITLTAPSFPTSHALTVSTYSDSGAELTSGSYMASSSTKIVVKTASSLVTSALIVVDPTTNRPLGAALFKVEVITIPPVVR